MAKKKRYHKNAKLPVTKSKLSSGIKSQIVSLTEDRISNGLISFDTKIYIHAGPTNSGKTYNAIQRLKKSNNGAFFAPLRLLAWEVYYRLNSEDIRTTLVTGEEIVEIKDSVITASTVEMFNPNKTYDCVVLDETQLLTDPNRGWAWLRVLLLCRTRELHIITSLDAVPLITNILKRLDKTFEYNEYKRLVPLEVVTKPFDIEKPIDKTIYVVFTREEIFKLKHEFENIGKKVSVVYGNLPPDIRKAQIKRFIDGTNDVCIATDAIGMGMNLPADNVCFVTMSKFDGKQVRQLDTYEIKQIAGRAGRYGLSEVGYVGALDKQNVKLIQAALASNKVNNDVAIISPEYDELVLLPGNRLYDKLMNWVETKPIPDSIKDFVKIADLKEQIALAKIIDFTVEKDIGSENCFKLIKAPVKRDNTYWVSCVKAIWKDSKLSVPYTVKVDTAEKLLMAEGLCNNCDVYCWIYNCTEFKDLCEDMVVVKEIKRKLSEEIDKFLLTKKLGFIENWW